MDKSKTLQYPIIEIIGFVIPFSSPQRGFRYTITPHTGGLPYGELEIMAIHEKPIAWVYGDIDLSQDTSFIDSMSRELPIHTCYFQIGFMDYNPTLIHKEFEGHRYEIGGLKLEGQLLDGKPETFMPYADFIQHLANEKPIELDHTRGEGTWYEQMASQRPEF